MKVYERPESIPIRDELLALAFDVYVNERPFWRQEKMEDARNHKKWQPINGAAFDAPISLSRVALANTEVCEPAEITYATLEVDDEMITVSPTNEVELYEDDFVKDLLERLKYVFYSHRHSICLDTGRRILAAERAKSGFQQPTALVTRRSVAGEILIP